MGYWQDIWLHGTTIAKGMGITLRYLFKPDEIVTVQYPHEIDSIPERHRGIHYLETDVCILCYQCSRACPVDCIEIEGTRVPNQGFEGAYTGAKGATITKFTIDYARCIFCNLCIEPCPVDCIHMGKEFDFSGYTRAEMVKNLLTDQIFCVDDQKRLGSARRTVLELEEKDKREKEEKKKAAAAAAAAAKAAAAAAPKPAAAPKESVSVQAALAGDQGAAVARSATTANASLVEDAPHESQRGFAAQENVGRERLQESKPVIATPPAEAKVVAEAAPPAVKTDAPAPQAPPTIPLNPVPAPATEAKAKEPALPPVPPPLTPQAVPPAAQAEPTPAGEGAEPLQPKATKSERPSGSGERDGTKKKRKGK